MAKLKLEIGSSPDGRGGAYFSVVCRDEQGAHLWGHYSRTANELARSLDEFIADAFEVA
jgi:hypothetical protein